jgi:hypothetical protein
MLTTYILVRVLRWFWKRMGLGVRPPDTRVGLGRSLLGLLKK